MSGRLGAEDVRAAAGFQPPRGHTGALEAAPFRLNFTHRARGVRTGGSGCGFLEVSLPQNCPMSGRLNPPPPNLVPTWRTEAPKADLDQRFASAIQRGSSGDPVGILGLLYVVFFSCSSRQIHLQLLRVPAVKRKEMKGIKPPFIHSLLLSF